MDAIREALTTLPDAVFADFLESESAYRLILDVPGVDAEGLSVEATDTALKLEARRQKSVPEEFEYHTDARSMVLEATIPLPPDADPDEATATLDRGVLTLDIPRGAGAGRTIPIEG